MKCFINFLKSQILICSEGNWIREFKKWCPCIRAIRMGGTKEERLHFEKEYLPVDPTTGKYKWDVLVTSYEGMLKERSKLAKIKWRYLIIDEAHRIKNENSSLSKAVRTVDVEHRLLITGTPLQVRLHHWKKMIDPCSNAAFIRAWQRIIHPHTIIIYNRTI